MLEAKANQYIVRVSCMTYNQAAYIEDAMNGFCMQKTTFPFICTIVDDASTDGEQEIIKKYLQHNFDLEDKTFVRNEETDDYVMTLARHKTNKNCHFAVYFLKYNHYSIKKTKQTYLERWNKKVKYIAFCEGDDYWTKPLKLQKQVGYLEDHPECGLTYTNYSILFQKNGNISYCKCKQTNFDDLLMGNKIGTLTVCLRTNLYLKYRKEIKPDKKGWKMADLPRWLFLAAISNVKLLPDNTATYRVLEDSASHSQSPTRRVAFLMSGYNIDVFFAKKYGREYLLKDIAKARVGHLINDSYNYDQNLPFCFTNFFFQNSIFDFKLYVISLTTHSRTLRKLHSFLISKRK